MDNHKVTFSVERVKKDQKISRWYNKKASFMQNAPEDGVVITGDGPGSHPIYLRDSDLRNLLSSDPGKRVNIQSWGDDLTLDFDVVK